MHSEHLAQYLNTDDDAGRTLRTLARTSALMSDDAAPRRQSTTVPSANGTAVSVRPSRRMRPRTGLASAKSSSIDSEKFDICRQLDLRECTLLVALTSPRGCQPACTHLGRCFHAKNGLKGCELLSSSAVLVWGMLGSLCPEGLGRSVSIQEIQMTDTEASVDENLPRPHVHLRMVESPASISSTSPQTASYTVLLGRQHFTAPQR